MVSSGDIATPQTTEEFYDFVGGVKSSDGYRVPAYFGIRVGDFVAFSEQRSKSGIYAVLHVVLDLGVNWSADQSDVASVKMGNFEITESLRLLQSFLFEDGTHANIDVLLRALYVTSSPNSQASVVLIPEGVDPDSIDDEIIRTAFQVFLKS